MGEALLGIDIGTSSCKTSIFDFSGQVLGTATGDYNVYYPQRNYVEQNPVEWFECICKTVKQVIALSKTDPKDIKGIGVDGQSWSTILVDKKGEVLTNNPIWMDNRAFEICEEIKREIGEKAIFDVSGNPFEATYGTPKIIWFKRNMPDIFKRTYKILQSNSYIVYKLTGKFSQDKCQSYALHFYDMRNGVWNKEMAAAMGIDLNLFPEFFQCHEVVGGVTGEASELTGLIAGTPVVAGGLDAACGTLGAGVVSAGQAQEQGGQAGGMSICIDRYRAHEKLIMSTHVVPDHWLLQGGTVGGGGTLRWLQSTLFEHLSFGEMSSLASEAAPNSDGLIFLPYMSGERSPIWDKQAKGVYFGLDYKKDKRHMIRATMEGAAYALMHNIKTAEEAGVQVDCLNAMGGAANSLIWTQIKSDVVGKPINVPSSDTATTLGAAILAGVGVGVYKDCKEAVEKIVKIQRAHTPNLENHEMYKKYYEIYIELYQKLKDSMAKL